MLRYFLISISFEKTKLSVLKKQICTDFYLSITFFFGYCCLSKSQNSYIIKKKKKLSLLFS